MNVRVEETLDPRAGKSMIENDSFRPPICIVIPFENQTDITARSLKLLVPLREELKELRCALILIDSATVADSDNLANEFLGHVPYVHVQNEESHGFSHAANLGLKQAADRHADVILLHPDTIVSAGAFREMQRVAYLDSMIGFVSPRSNVAGISSFPPQQEFQKTPPEAAQAIFKELSHYLPELQYVPAPSASCVFIKLEVLREFGLFDETYETSDDPTNDVVMRANQCGDFARPGSLKQTFAFSLSACRPASLIFQVPRLWCPKDVLQDSKDERLLGLFVIAAVAVSPRAEI